MDNEFNAVAECLVFFEKAKPEPTSKDIHTQIGCHFEEASEMCDAITPLDECTAQLLAAAQNSLHELAEHLKASDEVIRIMPENRIDFLDALGDQMVTAIGCAHMEKMDIINGFDEINNSNLSKFDADGEPIFDANRKVTKGPNYRKADLTPFV